MSRVGNVARTVPQGAWTALCALVLIASLGFAVVLGAGLSVWTGAVGSRARTVSPVVAPPGSGLVIVPGTHAQVRHPVTTTGAPPRAAVTQVAPSAPTPRRAPSPEPSRVPPVGPPPVTTPTQPPSGPTTVPGVTQTPTPPPVLPIQIVVALSKHGLVEKLTHALRDVDEPGDEAAKDQAQLVQAIAKAMAKGDASLLSPAPDSVPSELISWTPEPGDKVTSASDLTLVSVTSAPNPDTPSLAVLTTAAAATTSSSSSPAGTAPAAPADEAATAPALPAPTSAAPTSAAATSAGPAPAAPDATSSDAAPPPAPTPPAEQTAAKPQVVEPGQKSQHAHKAQHAHEAGHADKAGHAYTAKHAQKR